MYLVNKKIMHYPNGYTIKSEELDTIVNGKQHLANYFKNRPIGFNYHIEDLADIKDEHISEKETDAPDFYNIFNINEFSHILYTANSENERIPLTEKVVHHHDMTMQAFEKYLRLYEINMLNKNGSLIEIDNETGIKYINLHKLKIIQSEMNKYPRFNTSFG